MKFRYRSGRALLTSVRWHISRVSCYQSAMRSAGDISAAQSVLALTVLSLLMSRVSASYRNARIDIVIPDRDSCAPDIIDADSYKTEHPICSRLAAKTQARTIPVAAAKYWDVMDFERFPRARCAMRWGPMNVTLRWSSDPSRAASALLAALLRHVYKFQRVQLAREDTHSSFVHKSNELVISLAAVVQDKAANARIRRKGLTAFMPSCVPTSRKLHAWLTPAARLIGACQHTNWTFYSNLTALALCSFRVPLHYSFAVSIDPIEILGVGDDCNATMQKLQQRAEAAFTPTRAVFVNRTVFERYLRTSNHSFLFLDFDMWSGEPSVGVVESPPCVSDHDDGVCKPELDDSTGMLVTDSRMLKDNRNLFGLVLDFIPTPEWLRVLLGQEANGINLEEAACEMAEKAKSYVMDEMFMKVIPATRKPASPKIYDKQGRKKYTVATFLCVADPHSYSYDLIIRSVGQRIYKESPRLLDISFPRYFINCSDTYSMSRRLDDLMEQSDTLNMLGIVSLSVKGAAAASAVAAAHRVPLLLAHAVRDEHATGNTTWQTAGQLRHIALALQHFVNESGWTRVAVLSQPTTFAMHYFAALQDKATFFLRNFEIPLDLTDRLAEEALRDIRDANTRVVVVNTDSDAATLILAAAVELNMSYTDGFIWIVRDPRAKPECSTPHFTVSLSKVMEDTPFEQSIRSESEVGQLWPPHSIPLGDALMTVSRGFNNVFRQHSDMLTDLHSDQVIRAFDDSLKNTPVAGFNGVQLHYKERVLEEAFVYLDELCNDKFIKHRLLATWRVNATSGSVRDENGAHASLFCLNVKRDAGANVSDRAVRTDTDGGKRHGIVTDKPANTSNPVFLVHQWIESITKIETPVSGVSASDILNLNIFNKLNNNNLNILRIN